MHLPAYRRKMDNEAEALRGRLAFQISLSKGMSSPGKILVENFMPSPIFY
jgi:hypothetical protein